MKQEPYLEQRQQTPQLSQAVRSPELAATRFDRDVSSWQTARQMIIGSARGRVLEVGVGTWMNLQEYSRAIESLAGIEPNARRLSEAHQRAARLGWQVDLRQGQVEALPFSSGSFDTVLGTLVWCSVGDVPAGLHEVWRVLRPGGELRFLEHVRSETPWVARLQDWITPLSNHLAGGCHPNRDTEQAIRAAGFEVVQRRRLGVGLGPAWPILVGVAVKTRE